MYSLQVEIIQFYLMHFFYNLFRGSRSETSLSMLKVVEDITISATLLDVKHNFLLLIRLVMAGIFTIVR